MLNILSILLTRYKYNTLMTKPGKSKWKKIISEIKNGIPVRRNGIGQRRVYKITYGYRWPYMEEMNAYYERGMEFATLTDIKHQSISNMQYF